MKRPTENLLKNRHLQACRVAFDLGFFVNLIVGGMETTRNTTAWMVYEFIRHPQQYAQLQADLALALCLDVQGALREDLRLLVMSATLDGAAVARLLGDVPVLTSEGRSYPVQTRYRPTRAQFAREPGAFCDEVAQAVRAALQEQSGSLLVFLPGEAEIRRVEQCGDTLLGVGHGVFGGTVVHCWHAIRPV